jgi:hypothetical protein
MITRTTKTVRTTTRVGNADGSTTTTIVETVTEGGPPEPEPPWVKEADELFQRIRFPPGPWGPWS